MRQFLLLLLVVVASGKPVNNYFQKYFGQHFIQPSVYKYQYQHPVGYATTKKANVRSFGLEKVEQTVSHVDHSVGAAVTVAKQPAKPVTIKKEPNVYSSKPAGFNYRPFHHAFPTVFRFTYDDDSVESRRAIHFPTTYQAQTNRFNTHLRVGSFEDSIEDVKGFFAGSLNLRSARPMTYHSTNNRYIVNDESLEDDDVVRYFAGNTPTVYSSKNYHNFDDSVEVDDDDFWRYYHNTPSVRSSYGINNIAPVPRPSVYSGITRFDSAESAESFERFDNDNLFFYNAQAAKQPNYQATVKKSSPVPNVPYVHAPTVHSGGITRFDSAESFERFDNDNVFFYNANSVKQPSHQVSFKSSAPTPFIKSAPTTSIAHRFGVSLEDDFELDDIVLYNAGHPTRSAHQNLPTKYFVHSVEDDDDDDDHYD